MAILPIVPIIALNLLYTRTDLVNRSRMNCINLDLWENPTLSNSHLLVLS